MEYLELQNYKAKLEVLALEKTLNISRSKFTVDIEVDLLKTMPDHNHILLITNDNLVANADGTDDNYEPTVNE